MACGSHPLLLGILLHALAAPCWSDEGAREVLRAIRDQAQAIHASAQEAPAWLRPAPTAADSIAGAAAGQAAAARVRAQAQAGQSEACAALGADCDVPAPAVPDERLTLLVSWSLGDAALREIFTTAAHEGVRVVFRGVAQGEGMMAFVRRVHGLIQDLDPLPSVEIDPAPFRQIGATVVPVLVLDGPQEEIARVGGITSAAWLKDQVRAGQGGDLGIRGPVEPIAEPDMIAEIARRIRALDMDALRERAIQSFWSRAQFEHLPAADRERERLIDPTLQAKADIRHPDGRLIVRAGETVNPLDRMPFSLRLVVFDATSPAQVAKARGLGEAQGAGQPTYLATGFDRTRGWDGFRAIEDALDAPVYLLTPDLRDRFALERVPATVEAREGRFVVREYPPETQ